MKKIYIYGLSGDNGVIRYVGQSYRPFIRKNEHINDTKKKLCNKHKTNWIKKILKNNEQLNVIILEECDETNWVEREKYWITQFDNLTNISIGGDGCSYIKYKVPYCEVKTWVNENLLQIKNETDWRIFVKENKLPNFIPKRPDHVYKNRGWSSYSEFLNKTYNRIDFINLVELKRIISEKNINTISQYRIFRNENKKLNIPYDPTIIYKNDCKNWRDFLTPKTPKIKEKKIRNIVSFQKAKDIIKKHEFTKKVEYVKFVSNNLQLNLPWNPIKTYNKNWVSWQDFFGNNNPRIIKYIGGVKRNDFLSYLNTKKWINENYPNINTEHQWRKITNDLPKFIPKRPDYVYKNNEWCGWRDFLKK